MQFEIKVNTDVAKKILTDIQKKQLPFASSLALNRTSEKARDIYVKDLPGKITLRKSWWKPGNRFGFNVKNSNKTNLTAVIYTRAPWMALHETGGTKTPQKKALAIPHANVKRTKRDLISKANKPAGMKNKFIKVVNGQPLLFKRLNKGIKLMYTLVPSAKIKAVLQFRNTIKKDVNRIFPDEFNKAFDEAMRTRK
jgi:hypothetical protein